MPVTARRAGPGPRRARAREVVETVIVEEVYEEDDEDGDEDEDGAVIEELDEAQSAATRADRTDGRADDAADEDEDDEDDDDANPDDFDPKKETILQRIYALKVATARDRAQVRGVGRRRFAHQPRRPRPPAAQSPF